PHQTPHPLPTRRSSDLKEVVKVQQQYLDGAITHGERYNKIISLWSDVTEKVADEMFKALESYDKEGNINPVYVMADSGARGSKQDRKSTRLNSSHVSSS